MATLPELATESAATARRQEFLVSTGLAILLAAHMAAYGSWIIDDAGITFAYARNVSTGFGWVAQPGAAPVEGFTNLLWLLVLLPFFALDWFDLVWTPKLLGFACAFGSVILTRRAIRHTAPELRLWGDIGLLFLVLNPAFAIWCVSGLENGLFALLTAALLVSTVRSCRAPTGASFAAAIAAGAIAALTAAVRPDGLVLAALWPTTTLVLGDLPIARRVRLAATASAVTILGVAALTFWRWQVFGDFVPNTFHAKVGDTWGRASTAAALALALGGLQLLRQLPRLRGRRLAAIVHALLAFATLDLLGAKGITRSLAGEPGIVLLALAFAVVGSRPARSSAPWVYGTILALMGYQALPPDWMGEWRFGTAFSLLATPTITLALGTLFAALTGKRRWLLAAVFSAIGIVALVRATDRMLNFRQNPTVPMTSILELNERFVSWAADLELPNAKRASVLAADMGGALWLDKLDMMDLAGLCDPEFARLLGTPEACAEVALARKPTFIEFHSDIARRCGLPDSSAFRRDYLPIVEQEDDYATRAAGRPIRTGFYVRRALAPPPEVIDRWRQSLR
ncbi:MAG: hypothetical protein NXI31_21735 [bacterium]|nr:hypothetical protein [bacterium]